MKIRANFSINIDKLEENRLFAGKKGNYYNFTSLIDLDSQGQYNDNGFIAHDVSKEERDQGIKGAIVGNVKVVWKENEGQSHAPPNTPQSDFMGGYDDDEIPF